MEFSALKDDLLSAVQTVQYSASIKGMMPILSGVKIETYDKNLVFYSTDLESYTSTKCEAKIDEEGACVVNLKIFMDYIKDSDDEKINAKVVGNEMLLEGRKSKFKLYTMPYEDFPAFPDVQISLIEGLDMKNFMPAVQRVSKASSKDEKRPTLLGMLVELDEEGITMVSTDSYRLAIQKLRGTFKINEKSQYIIPSSAMLNMSRVAGKAVTISVFRDENRGQLRFSAGDHEFIIRLIEGKFPKYEQFIPDQIENRVEIGKEEMLRAIKRVSLISNTIKINVSEEGVELFSESRDVGEGSEKIDAQYGGAEIEIAFNCRFLEDGVTSMDGERFELGVREALKPGIIKEREGEDFIYIIMPIRM
ncbi:MAG: DNA polymerase III subunit beta [Actinomycetota bacterium]|nr:DNA polymerase III subunit beta [Actinomycetota bacterium]